MLLRTWLGWLDRFMTGNHYLPTLLALALAQSAEAGCQDPPGPRVDWTGCSRNLLMLGSDNLTAGVFTGAILTSTDFRSAKLTKAKLNEAELSFTRFGGADLSGADLSKAVGWKTDFTRANLDHANLSAADLSRAVFVEAKLAGANFSKAEVNRADFSRADLTGADLSKAELYRAVFTGAKLSGVRFSQRGAGIKGAAALTPAPTCSGDADVVRASQVQHAVEHVDSDVHLGRPTLIRMRAQPVADHLFPSANRGLGPGAFRIP